MKTKFTLSILVFLLFLTATSNAQGFIMPKKGKAIIYFIRNTGSFSFEYFHNDKYIGIFKGHNYMCYECDAGEQLFWVSSENKEFITADLKEGGIYIVLARNIMGAWKPRIKLEVVTPEDKTTFRNIKNLIYTKPPVITPETKIKTMNIKLEGFIKEKLRMYNEVWKDTQQFIHISPENAIPVEFLGKN